MTINKRSEKSFIVPVIHNGRQGLCHLNLSGMVANHVMHIPSYFLSLVLLNCREEIVAVVVAVVVAVKVSVDHNDDLLFFFYI